MPTTWHSDDEVEEVHGRLKMEMIQLFWEPGGSVGAMLVDSC